MVEKNAQRVLQSERRSPMPSQTKSEMHETPRTEADLPDKRLLDREGLRPRSGIDVNLYATKKSVAQGLMDIALLTSNAAQLKYILKEGDATRFYVVNVVCLGISIALQLMVGVLLILNTRYNINVSSQQSRAELLNNLTIIGVFMITVANVFVSSFGSSPR